MFFTILSTLLIIIAAGRAALSDYRERLISDGDSLLLFGAGIGLQAATAGVDGILISAICTVIVFGLLFVLSRLIYLGMGDVIMLAAATPAVIGHYSAFWLSFGILSLLLPLAAYSSQRAARSGPPAHNLVANMANEKLPFGLVIAGDAQSV